MYSMMIVDPDLAGDPRAAANAPVAGGFAGFSLRARLIDKADFNRWLAEAFSLYTLVFVAVATTVIWSAASPGNAEEFGVDSSQLSTIELVPQQSESAELANEPNGDPPASPPLAAEPSPHKKPPVKKPAVKASETVAAQTKTPKAAVAKIKASQAAKAAKTAAKKAAAAAQTPALQPIPEQQPGGPVEVAAASFKGVTPGATTSKQLQQAWGTPRKIRNLGRAEIYLFTVEPFRRVEVAVSDHKVLSIVVHLDKPFPAGEVAKQLQLNNIHPVFISNELGDVLGQSFPERGVMFAFVQNHKPGRPSMKVDKIVLEPIDAEAFLLRAETNIDTHYSATLHDLDIAVKLSPENAKAHWLRSRVLAAVGDTAAAVAAAGKAVQLDSDNTQYRMALARVLAQAGRLEEAMQHVQTAIENSDNRPHIKAACECLLGDLLSMGEEANFAAALKAHMAAIKTADPLSVDRHPAIRLAAKEVLIDAHLGAAATIAWGAWHEKEKAVEKWCQRAAAFAEELIANDGGSEELRFRVATRSLAAYVGVKGKLDPKQYADQAVRVGEVLISLCDDSAKKRQLQCDLGTAMFNAMQISQARKDNKSALVYGEKTAAYMEAAIEQGLDNPGSYYLLGRLYFRIGAIHALAQKDHAAAICWFDKAVPLLSRPLPSESKSELGRHGETFVSMGVSYWSTGEKDKSVELTKLGLELMKKAVGRGLLHKSALSVPYQNLAAMQRHLGNTKSATQFERLAKLVKSPTAEKKSLQR